MRGLAARYGKTDEECADHLKHRNIFGTLSGIILWVENISKAAGGRVSAQISRSGHILNTVSFLLNVSNIHTLHSCKVERVLSNSHVQAASYSDHACCWVCMAS